jgi:hypothetical protein
MLHSKYPTIYDQRKWTRSKSTNVTVLIRVDNHCRREYKFDTSPPGVARG